MIPTPLFSIYCDSNTLMFAEMPVCLFPTPSLYSKFQIPTGQFKLCPPQGGADKKWNDPYPQKVKNANEYRYIGVNSQKGACQVFAQIWALLASDSKPRGVSIKAAVLNSYNHVIDCFAGYFTQLLNPVEGFCVDLPVAPCWCVGVTCMRDSPIWLPGLCLCTHTNYQKLISTCTQPE